jgi:hypothetical protein
LPLDLFFAVSGSPAPAWKFRCVAFADSRAQVASLPPFSLRRFQFSLQVLCLAPTGLSFLAPTRQTSRRSRPAPEIDFAAAGSFYSTGSELAPANLPRVPSFLFPVTVLLACCLVRCGLRLAGRIPVRRCRRFFLLRTCCFFISS